ncbi:MAG: hypothetical protein JWM41_3075 [Gemmatimonadetes bacterium]|nr:hypothetical protein [Gemmatimonadota bacterium]
MELDQLRIFIYAQLADHGAAPTSDAIASHFGTTPDDAREALVALGKSRAVILHPASREIWMAAPFSAVSTRFRVHGARASWWANCAWDMFGIPAFLSESVRIDAMCADCNEHVEIDVDARDGPRSSDGLVHILLPARRWYDDIGFT